MGMMDDLLPHCGSPEEVMKFTNLLPEWGIKKGDVMILKWLESDNCVYYSLNNEPFNKIKSE